MSKDIKETAPNLSYLIGLCYEKLFTFSLKRVQGISSQRNPQMRIKLKKLD